MNIVNCDSDYFVIKCLQKSRLNNPSSMQKQYYKHKNVFFFLYVDNKTLKVF